MPVVAIDIVDIVDIDIKQLNVCSIGSFFVKIYEWFYENS